MVARLDQLGAPVKLAIGLDSVFRTSLSGRVGKYINFYIANGNGEPVARTAQLQGKLENINVQNVPGVGHMPAKTVEELGDDLDASLAWRRLEMHDPATQAR